MMNHLRVERRREDDRLLELALLLITTGLTMVLAISLLVIFVVLVSNGSVKLSSYQLLALFIFGFLGLLILASILFRRIRGFLRDAPPLSTPTG